MSSEEGEYFNISLNDGSVSFILLEYTKKEAFNLLQDIKEQIELLEQSYKKEEANS